MIGARVTVQLKRSVLDPQGDAVRRSLGTLGHDNVRDVRIGRVIELVLDETDHERAGQQVEAMCSELLANPVIEGWSWELVDASTVGGLLREEAPCG